MMRSSEALFDALSGTYDEHFEVLHRRTYDELAWEQVRALLPESPGLVVDAGCGTGRWVPRLLELGHRVIGIEQAAAMADRAARLTDDGRFSLLRGSMDDVEIPAGSADLVIAMGSVQYTADPRHVIARFAGWVRPGGGVCVLVDSKVALAIELIQRRRQEEAFERLSTSMGTFRVEDACADHHLLDAGMLTDAFVAAGLVEVRAMGLLVSASILGLEGLTARLRDDPEQQLDLERHLATEPLLADLGKQLLVTGSRVR